MDALKFKTTEEIKQLMKLVEELNHKISKKDNELCQSKKEVEVLRCSIDEQIGNKIGELQTEFKKKYEEDVRKVECIYDTMMLEHIRKSDTELKSIDKCNELEKQIAHCQQTYEQDITRFKKELLEKSKHTEEHLLLEIEKHKQEADKYKQQVENLKNDLSEELQNIKREYYFNLNKFESKTIDEGKTHCYQEEIEQLSKELQIYSLNEATREVELETLKHELQKKEDLLSELEKYKESVQVQNSQLDQLQCELNHYKDTNSMLKEKLYECQMSEHKLLSDIQKSSCTIEDYKQQLCAVNEKIRFDANKYDQMNKTFEEKVLSLTNALENNIALHKEEVIHLRSIINEKQVEINSLQAKVQEVNQVTVGEMTSVKHFNDLISDTSSKEFLLDILKGLIQIKIQVKPLFESEELKSIPQREQSSLPYENPINFTAEELTLEVANTLDDILNMTQYLQKNLVLTSVPQHRTMSTTNGTQSSDRDGKDANKILTPEKHDIQSSNNLVVNCSKLEEENASLSRSLKLMVENLFEMETCLIVVSQDMNLFNKRCQILDGKLNELENTKLSEYLLRKENDELKQNLKNIEESGKRLHEEFGKLQENNINLEKKVIENVSIALQNIEKSDSHSEFRRLLTDLKDKTNEVVELKSQVACLQSMNKEQRSSVLDVQSKYDYLVAQNEYLTGELNSKTKELEDIWQEKYSLSTENKLLHRKLVFQRILPFESKSVNCTEPKSDDITSETGNAQFDGEVSPVPEQCINNRIESSSHSIDNSFINISSLSPLHQMHSLHKHWNLQKQDQVSEIFDQL